MFMCKWMYMYGNFLSIIPLSIIIPCNKQQLFNPSIPTIMTNR